LLPSFETFFVSIYIIITKSPVVKCRDGIEIVLRAWMRRNESCVEREKANTRYMKRRRRKKKIEKKKKEKQKSQRKKH